MKAKWEIFDRHYDKNKNLIAVRWFCHSCSEYCIAELPPGKTIYHCEIEFDPSKKRRRNNDRGHPNT